MKASDALQAFGAVIGKALRPLTGAEVKVSLRRQLGLLQGQHFHLNVIAVGVGRPRVVAQQSPARRGRG